MCVTIQLQAPEYSLDCVDGEGIQSNLVRLSDFAGHWLALLFYPRDFSLIASSELKDFSAAYDEFERRECKVLALSADSIATHCRWLETSESAGGLGPVRFPLASDPKGQTAQVYGAWNRERQNSESASFVIDPDGVVQHVAIYHPKVGRCAADLLRMLDALQTKGLCPAMWASEDESIGWNEAFRPNQVVGQYRLRQKLGSGTFGNVFLAEDLRQGREVAVKILKPDAGVFGRQDFVDVQLTLVC